jgi:hypothetical protein
MVKAQACADESGRFAVIASNRTIDSHARKAASLSAADRGLLAFCSAAMKDSAQAWEAWLAALPQDAPGQEPSYSKFWRDLLPLAGWKYQALSLSGPDWLRRRLRMACVLEGRRLTAVYETCQQILSAPPLAELEPLTVGGLALGERVYPAPASRHTGLLSLHLPDGTNLRPLRRYFKKQGYAIRQAGWGSFHWPFADCATLWLHHPSGFQVYLSSLPHWRSAGPVSYSLLSEGREAVTTTTGFTFIAPSLHASWQLAERGWGRERSGDSVLWMVDAVFLDRTINDGAGVNGMPAPRGTKASFLHPVVRFAQGEGRLW